MEAFIKIYLYRTDLFNDPEIQAAFKEKTGKDLAPAKTHEEYTEIAEFFTEWGQDNGKELWGTTAQAHTGHPASWYEFFESIAPTFGVYNWGIDADQQLRRLGRERRHDEQRQGQGGAEVLAAPARHRPAGIGRQHLDRGRHHLRRRPRRPGPRLRRERRLDRLRPGEVEGRRQCRRRAAAVPSPACSRTPKPARATSATTTAAPSACRSPRRTRRPRCCSCSTSARTRCSRAGRSPRRASPTRRPTTIPGVIEMDEKLGGYYTMLKDQGKLFAGAPPYPFHAQVREATAPIFYEILTGEVEPDAGLDQMAAAAEAGADQPRLPQVDAADRPPAGARRAPAASRSSTRRRRDALEQSGLAPARADPCAPRRLRHPPVHLRALPGVPPVEPVRRQPEPGLHRRQQLPPAGLRRRVPLLDLGHAEVRLLRGRLRDRARLPARPALHARVPRPRLLPHHPHPAADRGADRRRLGLAADDHALASASSRTISNAWFGYRPQHRPRRHRRLRAHRHHGHLALDAARHADAARRARCRCPRSRSSRRRSTAPAAARSSGTSPCR